MLPTAKTTKEMLPIKYDRKKPQSYMNGTTNKGQNFSKKFNIYYFNPSNRNN